MASTYYSAQHIHISAGPDRQSSGIQSNWDVKIALGDVGVGFEKQIPFTISNDFTHPLKVSRVHTGCKCTAAEFVTDEVNPGRDLEGCLTVRVPTREGPFSTAATVHFEALEKTARLSVSGTAVAPFRVIPAALKFRGIRGHKLAEVEPLTFEIQPSTTVCRLLAKPDWCDFGISSAEGQLWGTVAVGEAKDRRGVVVLSDQTGHVVNIPVHVELSESWTVHPSLIHFGRVTVGEETTRSVVVRCHSEVTPDVHIDSDCDAVTFGIEQLSERLFKVTCTFMPQEPGYLNGQIRIHLGEITKNVSVQASVRT